MAIIGHIEGEYKRVATNIKERAAIRSMNSSEVNALSFRSKYTCVTSNRLFRWLKNKISTSIYSHQFIKVLSIISSLRFRYEAQRRLDFWNIIPTLRFALIVIKCNVSVFKAI